MVGVFKEHLNISCDKWLAEIAQNGGSTRIDISVEFERIFAHTINHICFGEDLNDERFDFQCYDKMNFLRFKKNLCGYIDVCGVMVIFYPL